MWLLHEVFTQVNVHLERMELFALGKVLPQNTSKPTSMGYVHIDCT